MVAGAGLAESGDSRTLRIAGDATESKDTVVDRRMGRQIGAKTERVRNPIDLPKALKHANSPGRVEAGGAYEQQTQFVCFEFLVLGVGTLQRLEADLANPGREGSSARRD